MRIILIRPHSSYYKQRHFKVKINGRLLDYIANDEIKEIDIYSDDQLQIMIDTFTGSSKIKISELKEGSRIIISPKPFLAVFPLAGLFILVFMIAISYIGNDIGQLGNFFIGLLLVAYIPFLTFWKDQWLKIDIEY